MKHKLHILLLILLTATLPAFAQVDKEERKEQQDEKKAANRDKVDYNVFRRQIIALKEYADERRKIPALQKTNKGPIKIVAVVDSLSDNDDPKKLTGYIQENTADNSVNIYEITFDRVSKKIISVKPTGEALEEDKDETATEKKSPAKHVTAEKKKDENDGDDEDEEKPAKKKKQKDEDED